MLPQENIGKLSVHSVHAALIIDYLMKNSLPILGLCENFHMTQTSPAHSVMILIA
jgi:hypothetical protein